MTLYQIQCFRVNILKNCSMFSMFLNVSQCFSMFLNVFQCFSMFLNFFSIFFNFFGQKGRLNYNFRTNFTLLIINKKNLTWDLIFAYFGQFSAIWKCWQYLKKLQHWNIEINIETLKTLNQIQCWNFEKHWHRIEFQCSFFWHRKHWIEINVNVGADP